MSDPNSIINLLYIDDLVVKLKEYIYGDINYKKPIKKITIR